MMDFLNALMVVLLKIVDIGLNLYILLLICRTIITHIDIDPHHYLVRFLESITEPILELIRKKIPSYYGSFDFSPITLLVAICIVKILIMLVI